MKPLNQAERTTRLWKFTLFYILALALPLLASYYLFSDGTIADENQKLKRELEQTRNEQKRLVVYLDTLTNHLRRIDQTDQLLRDETNYMIIGRLNTKNQDNVNSIASVLSAIRSDTTTMKVPTSKMLASSVLRDFELFRSNRNTIDFLRQALNEKGVNVTDCEKLQARLDKAESTLAIFQAAAANRPAPAASGGGGGGGGGGRSSNSGDLQRRLQASLLEVKVLTDKVAFANADCLRLRASGKSSAQRKEMLQQARKGFIEILQEPSSQEMKSSAEKMVDAIDKELGRKRGLFGYR